MKMFSCPLALTLSVALLVLVQAEKRSSDAELNDLLKALLEKNSEKSDLENLDKHHDGDDDDDKTLSGEVTLYERVEYVEKMIEYQQRENERSALGEDFYREGESDWVEGRQMNALSASQQNEIINMHNDLRRKSGGSDMSILRFNPKLANLAQQWAQRCRMEHGQPPFSASDVGWKDLGQSYAAHTAKDWKPTQGVQAWYDEIKDYDYNSNSCRGVCGHYTALVWGETTDIGCGIAHCGALGSMGAGHLLVCNYGPPGNWQGKKPFLKGAACTQCASGSFFCNNGLCDKSCTAPSATCQCKADCQRGGTKTNDCKCKCKEGSIGPNCAGNNTVNTKQRKGSTDACKDLDDKCGRNPGYPEPFCKMAGSFGELVLKSCPKLCGTCKAVRDSSSNDYILKKLMLEYLENKIN